MEKRAYFKNWPLGVLLGVPQLFLIFTFFYWPAGQAVYWAFTLQQPWGGGNVWVGFDNFVSILSDTAYWGSIIESIVFAGTATGVAMLVALMMALLTDRELRGHQIYRTVLIWPYAIAAPALGVAFRFIFAPQAGFLAFVNHIWPGIWDPTLNGIDAMVSIVLAYAWK